MRVNIPFNNWSKAKLREGHKVCTTRRTQKGKPGQFFMVGHMKFQILYVQKFPLWFIRDFLYALEGADSPEEFERVWKNIYGSFKRNQEYYTHFFTNPYRPFLFNLEDIMFKQEESKCQTTITI